MFMDVSHQSIGLSMILKINEGADISTSTVQRGLHESGHHGRIAAK